MRARFEIPSIWLGLALAGSGCGGPGPEAPSSATPPKATAAPKPAERSVEEYKLVGVVREVKPEKKLVTIRHEDIPGFMPAMTMPFTLKQAEIFEDLRPGDEVEGRLVVRKEKGEVAEYDLEDLAVTRPAPPQAFKLDLSGGTPALKAIPPVLKPGEAVPDFSVTTQGGTTLKLSDLRGKVVALTFIYTRCPIPDFCPLMDRRFGQLAEAIRAVPARAEHVRLLSISFDPEHDTPAVLTAHARTRGAEPPLWTFAVATHQELGQIGPRLGLTYGPSKDEIIHNLTTAVIDAEGKLVRLEAGKGWEVPDLAKTILGLIPRPGG
jgi:protein SCO1/2